MRSSSSSARALGPPSAREPLALPIKERISADRKRAPQLVQGCEDLVEVSALACTT